MCSYVYQISFICFTLIRNTTEVFQGCFPSALCSACVAWAKYRIGDFNAIILRQLDEYPEGDATRKECMQIVHGEAAVLKDVGLDLQDFIGRQDETDGSLPVKQASSGPQAEGLGLSHA